MSASLSFVISDAQSVSNVRLLRDGMVYVRASARIGTRRTLCKRLNSFLIYCFEFTAAAFNMPIKKLGTIDFDFDMGEF